MRFQAPRLRVCLSVVLLVFGFSFLPVRVSADHEIEETKEAIAKSIRKTFDDFNNDDYIGFIDGFTDLGFLNKKLFAMHVETPVPKDEIAVFFGAMKLKGPVTVRNLSNIRVLDHAMVQATAEIEIQQGHVRERYGLWMVKRLGLDRRYKIEKDVRLPLLPDGFPVVDVKITEHKIEFDKNPMARDMVLKIANASTIAHELIVFHKVMPADWEDSVGRGARELKPGETVDLVLTGLDPGEYAMVCCRVDADSKPHCDKGERTEFSIN